MHRVENRLLFLTAMFLLAGSACRDVRQTTAPPDIEVGQATLVAYTQYPTPDETLAELADQVPGD